MLMETNLTLILKWYKVFQSIYIVRDRSDYREMLFMLYSIFIKENGSHLTAWNTPREVTYEFYRHTPHSPQD